MEAREIILKPLVTERTTSLMAEGKYVFKVAKKANKVEIRKAVEEIWGVKVLSVNTVNVAGKTKRVGRNVGRTSDYKKAIVKLAPGNTIEFFQA